MGNACVGIDLIPSGVIGVWKETKKIYQQFIVIIIGLVVLFVIRRFLFTWLLFRDLFLLELLVILFSI